jgi:hypothetical protein
MYVCFGSEELGYAKNVTLYVANDLFRFCAKSVYNATASEDRTKRSVLPLKSLNIEVYAGIDSRSGVDTRSSVILRYARFRHGTSSVLGDI